jgi:hypothetical protein
MIYSKNFASLLNLTKLSFCLIDATAKKLERWSEKNISAN